MTTLSDLLFDLVHEAREITPDESLTMDEQLKDLVNEYIDTIVARLIGKS